MWLLLGVFVPYALVKSVFRPALQLTICSCTFILSSELRWLVSSHFMYYNVRCGCRVSQFSMFLIWQLVDFSRKCYPICQSQLLLVTIIESSLLKLVFRVHKEKSHFFSSSCVLRMTDSVQLFVKARGLLFRCVEGAIYFCSPKSLWWPTFAHWDLFLELSWDLEIHIFSPGQNIVCGEHCFYI